MRIERTVGTVVLCCLLIGLYAGMAQAGQYDLEIFTNNGSFADDPAVVLSVEVLAEDDDEVRFEFHNNSTVASSIVSIYFDDHNLLDEIEDLLEGPGTSFSPGANPSNLPAGQDLFPAFETTDDLLADSDSPKPQNGINPGEWLAIIIELQDNVSFTDVTEALNDESLRIGVHVIAFSDGSSESAATPEPATLGLLGIGGFLFLSRRRRRL